MGIRTFQQGFFYVFFFAIMIPSLSYAQGIWDSLVESVTEAVTEAADDALEEDDEATDVESETTEATPAGQQTVAVETASPLFAQEPEYMGR